MKKAITILLIFISVNLLAQSYPITVSLAFSNNPGANTINWGDGTSNLIIKASTKSTGTKIDPAVEESKILLLVKKGGSKICGAFTSNSAPSANLNAAMKVWVGKNAVSLLGQNCVLAPGDYTISVQFFGNTAGGFKPLSEETSKPFSIKPGEQKTLMNSNSSNTNNPVAQPSINTRNIVFGDTSSTKKVSGGGPDNNSKSKTITRNWIADDTSSTKTITRNWIADDTSSTKVKVKANSSSSSINRNWIADDTSSTKVDHSGTASTNSSIAQESFSINFKEKSNQNSVACDCAKDKYVIAQVNSIGYKIRCNETKLLELGSVINFIPQNICDPAKCLTDWNMAVNDAKTGAFITSGTVASSTSSIPLTFNSENGYKITWAGHCNGKKCECTFWIKKK
jgi:hypothetical protein